jgi:aflatoxin B1 aldehyde reductase
MPLITQSPKNRIILGLMTFGPPGTEAKGARVTTLEDYNACLDYFQKEGYNEVDTARAYISGDQEAWSKEANGRNEGSRSPQNVTPASQACIVQ